MDLLNAFIVFANFVLIPAVSYGAQLALGALGVTLIYGILRFSNIAHGDTMAFGTMVTILVTWWFQAMGRFYREQKAKPVILVIVSMGVMFVLNGLVRFIIGPDDQRFGDGERFIVSARTFREITGLDEGLAFRTSQGLTIVVAAIAVAALFWFLNSTRTGKSMRAFSDNEDLALLSGINPEKVVTVAWLLAAALATVAGTLYGLDKAFAPFTYFQLLLPIFASAVVGGLGSPVGAIAGGFIIAFSEVTFTYAFRRVLDHLLPEAWMPGGLVQLLSTDYKFAVSFTILVIVLVYRPTGLFQGKAA
jgi:branched-chain amino acid transport system permease protein